jgi:hypothetical protein
MISTGAGKSNDADLPAVRRFAAMGGAAVAVEAVVEGVSVEARRFDPPDAGGGEASDDIGFEVEVGFPSLSVGEKALVIRIVGEQAFREGVVHLIGSAGDAGADGSGNVLDAGTE